MIEFETKTLKSWRKRALNPNVIGECTLTEGTLVISYNCDIEGERGDTLFAETTKPALEEIWQQINSKPKQKMISFEFVGLLEENSNGQIHFEADTISGFKRTPAGIVLFFHDPSIADMPIKKGETRESLDDIWQQLCEAKGIAKSEVKE